MNISSIPVSKNVSRNTRSSSPMITGRTPRPPRILFVGESICLAHVGRPALLARWAREAGYDVHFACGPSFAQAARDEGLNVLDLETVALHTVFKRLDQGQFFYSQKQLEGYVTAERALLKKVKPDLVVGDFRLTLPVSAALEKTACLSIVNAHWSPEHPCKHPAPRAGIFKHLGPGPRNALFSLVRPLVFRLFAKNLDDLRAQKGLPRLKDFRKMYTAGDACAYLDLPELAPLAKVPNGHFYLGPLTWTPANARRPKIEKLPGKGPLVYVSMGSSGDETIIPTILKALERCACEVVLSGIENKRVKRWLANLPGLQGRLISGQLMNPDDVLKRARLTICHSGSGTVYQSLAQGVPLLCIPHNPDQGLVAMAVKESGVGSVISPDQIEVRRLKKTITETIQHPEYRAAAAHMSLALRTCDTRERWLRWLNARLVDKETTVHDRTKDTEERLTYARA